MVIFHSYVSLPEGTFILEMFQQATVDCRRVRLSWCPKVQMIPVPGMVGICGNPWQSISWMTQNQWGLWYSNFFQETNSSNCIQLFHRFFELWVECCRFFGGDIWVRPSHKSPSWLPPGVSPVATPTCSPHISPRVDVRLGMGGWGDGVMTTFLLGILGNTMKHQWVEWSLGGLHVVKMFFRDDGWQWSLLLSQFESQKSQLAGG